MRPDYIDRFMTKRAILFLIPAMLIAVGAMAQKDSLTKKDTIWRKGGMANLSFNQVSLSDWAAGGDNSYGGNALLSL